MSPFRLPTATEGILSFRAHKANNDTKLFRGAADSLFQLNKRIQSAIGKAWWLRLACCSVQVVVQNIKAVVAHVRNRHPATVEKRLRLRNQVRVIRQCSAASVLKDCTRAKHSTSDTSKHAHRSRAKTEVTDMQAPAQLHVHMHTGHARTHSFTNHGKRGSDNSCGRSDHAIAKHR